MFRLLAMALFLAVVLPVSSARAEGGAAVLLRAGGGVDTELVADLSEVLVSALLQGSKETYNFVGKEALGAELEGRRSTTGGACKDSLECLRSFAREKSYSLLVTGEVARTATGHRLEITRVSLDGGKDRTERKVVDSDVTGLIMEVEAAATWILQPEPAFLVLRILPNNAQVKLDGQPLRVVQNQPVEIKSGAHTLELMAPDYKNLTKTLTCGQGATCRLDLELEKAPMAVAQPQQEIPRPPAKPTKTYKILAWSSAGLAVAALGVGAFYGFKLKGAEDDYTKRAQSICGSSAVCTNPTTGVKVTKADFDAQMKSIEDDGALYATMATASFVTMGVATAASGLFFLLHSMQDSPAEAAWNLTPIGGDDFGGIGLHIEF
jgi:hypothetical protein